MSGGDAVEPYPRQQKVQPANAAFDGLRKAVPFLP